MIIPANENICKNQLVWIRMDLCFHIVKPSEKQLHAPQHGENTCNCINLNILDVVHKEEHRDMGRDLRMWRENELVGYIIVCKSREEDGISGKWAGIKCLCFHSRQNCLFGLFKKAGASHGDCSEPWHTKLALAIHLERSNQTLIIVTTCEREGGGVLLICSVMMAARSLHSESRDWAPNKDHKRQWSRLHSIRSNRMHSSIWAALLFARFSVATESLAWFLWPRYLAA